MKINKLQIHTATQTTLTNKILRERTRWQKNIYHTIPPTKVQEQSKLNNVLCRIHIKKGKLFKKQEIMGTLFGILVTSGENGGQLDQQGHSRYSIDTVVSEVGC